MKIIKKIWRNRWICRSILSTLYFNFHYLPLRQAMRLPILLYKPKLIKCSGKVSIESERIYPGMICLGRNSVSIYPNNGFIWECSGTVIFKGVCYIGNSSALSVGKSGHIVFGNNFHASTMLRLVSYYSILFCDDVHIGWECTIMDTDMHKMTYTDNKTTKGYGTIRIGKNNWIGTRCIILKNTDTPDFCTISAGSIVNRHFDHTFCYSIIGPDTKITKKRDKIYRDMNNDTIDYETL